ncbi:unnamed protein product [Arctia plantaginis]|uniref:BZIP domain-containing protein n=1 Tax=Arctia plantaginis TaxID=874455 RepID=A0A8S0Z5S1_ARCPL|nr:unnamed protein product [Arctia plantaginis]
MAFWTPWLHETALDLSTNSASSSRRNSPSPYVEAPQSPYYGYISPQPTTYHPGLKVKPNIPSPPESKDSFDSESLTDDENYQQFERESFEAMAAKNGGSLLGNNPRMRRQVQPSQETSDTYTRQRQRNNIAAKQSRDRRKLREARLAVQVTYLKKQVAELKARLNQSVCARCEPSCI